MHKNAKTNRSPESPGSICSQDDSEYNIPPPVPRKSEHERPSGELRDAVITRMPVVAEEPRGASKDAIT